MSNNVIPTEPNLEVTVEPDITLAASQEPRRSY